MTESVTRRFSLPPAGTCVLAILLAGCQSPDQWQADQEFRSSAASYAPPPPAGAGESSPPAIPAKAALSDYLAFAAMNNPGLQAAFERWKAALERIPQEKSLADPQFSYKYYIIAQAMRDGDMRNMYQISQTIPWFGRLELRGDMAAQEARSQHQRFEMERLRLFARVKQAYYECAYLRSAIEIARRNVDQFKTVEDAAQARYSNGAGGQGDLIRAQIETARMQNEVQSMLDMLQATCGKLNAALGRPAGAELAGPFDLPAQAGEISEASLRKWMEESNPDLKAMDFDIARQKKAIELAGKDYFPDLMVGFEYDQMTTASGVEMSGGMKDPIALMFTLNVPIWWDKYAAGVREARSRFWAAQRDKADKVNFLQADLKMAVYNARNAQRKIDLYRDTLLPKARSAQASAQASYRTGTMTLTDLIDSQKVLLDFELSYQRSLADRLSALAEIEMIVGRSLVALPPAMQPAPTSLPASAPSKPKA